MEGGAGSRLTRQMDNPVQGRFRAVAQITTRNFLLRPCHFSLRGEKKKSQAHEFRRMGPRLTN